MLWLRTKWLRRINRAQKVLGALPTIENVEEVVQNEERALIKNSLKKVSDGISKMSSSTLQNFDNSLTTE